MLRLLSIYDYDELRELWNNSPGIGLNEMDDSKEGIEKYLKRNPSTCFAAIVDGKLAGAILCGHDGRRGYIHHTAVAAEFKRQGIGKALVAAALCALRGQGINKCALVAFKTNKEGNDFWNSLGFEKREDLNYRNMLLV